MAKKKSTTRTETKTAPTEAPKSNITSADVFRFQCEQQHRMVLKGAEELLRDVQDLVARLKAGAVPTTALNVNTVGRVMTDHAKLVALTDALEVVTSTL